jgi:hypothetical protein
MSDLPLSGVINNIYVIGHCVDYMTFPVTCTKFNFVDSTKLLWCDCG